MRDTVVQYHRFHAEVRSIMRTLKEVFKRDLTVSEDLRIDGVVLGNVTVRSGCTLDLDGVCWGNLDVDAGGSASVSGFVKGTVTNSGGRIDVSGVIWGKLRELAGTTDVEPGAIVRRRSRI